ncbi:MAG: hypothetical protein ACJ8BW_40840 [Ktedonobacteraceae bacterium]
MASLRKAPILLLNINRIRPVDVTQTIGSSPRKDRSLNGDFFGVHLVHLF